MKYFFGLLFISISLFASGEDGYIDFNPLYFEGEGYEIYDVKGPNNTWTWANRIIKMSNWSENPNDNQEYPESEDWLVLGPYNIAGFEEVKFAFDFLVDYGANATSVMACSDFPGYDKELIMPGTWKTLLAADAFNPSVGKDTTISLSLAEFEGETEVYIAFKYESALTPAVMTNVVSRFELTRNVNDKIVEMLPAVAISRSKDGEEYFNLPGVVGDDGKWTIRTGYAKVNSGNNLWLIMKSFDLTTSGDAFFSFESQLLSGTIGPVGLELKVANVKFDENSDLNEIQWDDYSVGRVDHRIYPTDYFPSGKLDLSKYIGDWVTVAFRYFNPQGEQYAVKNFQMFHLPDADPPVILSQSLSRVVYNAAYLDLKSNEAGTLHWAAYPKGTTMPHADSLRLGVDALAGDSAYYEIPHTDSTFTLAGLESDKEYELFFFIKDVNNNYSDISAISFKTPYVDLTAPELKDISFFEITNLSTKLTFGTTEPCNYYYQILPAVLDTPVADSIIALGGSSNVETGLVEHEFYGLEKNTAYRVYVVCVDYSNNQSEVFALNITTSNDDLDAPVIEQLTLTEVGDNTADFKLTINEKGSVNYVVQTATEIAPDIDGIRSGERAVTQGNLNYEIAGKAVDFSVDGLRKDFAYILYLSVVDSAGNEGLVKALKFKTTYAESPEIDLVSDERIVIGREASFTIEKDLFEVLNNVDVTDYTVAIFEGEHYTFTNNTILADDNFTGRITVPVRLTKNPKTSNMVELDFIVDYKTVQDSLKGLIRNMAGNRLNNPLDDMSSALAILQLKDGGYFFDQPGVLSKEYPEFMTTVLGGRMINIASDYYSERFRPRKATTVRQQMYEAMTYWIDNKPDYMEPDAPLLWPNYMGAIVLAFYDGIQYDYIYTPSRRNEIDTLFKKLKAFNHWCWESEEYNMFQPYEGSNLSGRLWGTMALAAVTGDVDLSFEVYDKVMEQLVLKPNSNTEYPAGIMPDGSFCMNNKSGSQWNWYSYGFSWFYDLIEYAQSTKRTNWRLPQEKFDLLGHAMTEGMMWLHWNDFIPHTLNGKYYSARGSRKAKNTVLNDMNNLRFEGLVNNAWLEKNEKIFNSYDELKEEFFTYDSTKFFWNANALIQSTPDEFTTLFIPSKKTGGFETGLDTIYGGENWFLGDGAVFTFNDFGAYNERHVLDHTKLPGTTVERRNIILPPNFNGTNGKHNNEFAAGLSDGKNALCTFFYDRAVNTANVTGFKSYFFFDGGYVAMGAGLNKAKSNRVYEVATTLEQEVHTEEIYYSSEQNLVKEISGAVTNYKMEFDMEEPAWFFAKSKGYYIFPDQNYGTNVRFNAEEHYKAWDIFNGTWKLHTDENNYNPSYNLRTVFDIQINHGKEFEDAAYAYMMTSGKSKNSYIEYITDQPVRLISNTKHLQAVHHTTQGLYAIVFIDSLELDLSKYLRVKVDKPAIVLIKEHDNGFMEAWVNDPYQKESLIELIIEKKGQNIQTSVMQRWLVMPQGVNKGKAAYTNNQNVWDYIEAQSYDESGKSVDMNTGLNVAKAYENLIIYPVPLADDILNVQFRTHNKKKVWCHVVNVLGQRLSTNMHISYVGLNNLQVNCTGLKSGVYYLILESEGERDVKSFIKE